MKNKNTTGIVLAFLLGLAAGYLLHTPLNTGDQSAAVQKTAPNLVPLKLTASSVSWYNMPTTLSWSSPANLNLANCQGTSTDTSGNTIPTTWNGPKAGLNSGNNFLSTMPGVPVPIDKVIFKITCQSLTGGAYSAQVQTTIPGSTNPQISITPGSVLPGGTTTVTYSYSNMMSGSCAGTASPTNPTTQDWTLHSFPGASNSGTTIIHPPSTAPGYVTIYTLSCMGSSGGSTSASAAVMIR